jgi:hypothetical protein
MNAGRRATAQLRPKRPMRQAAQCDEARPPSNIWVVQIMFSAAHYGLHELRPLISSPSRSIYTFQDRKYGILGQALYKQARRNKSKANTNLCIQITNKSELFWVESIPMSTQTKRHNSHAVQHSKNNLMPLSQMQSTFQVSSSQSFQTDNLLFIFGFRHPTLQEGLHRPRGLHAKILHNGRGI